MKNSKKAFTIVELVIVIAVIAILAAVLIPTFSSLIDQANVNSDIAAVKQMNTYLASDEQINGKPSDWQGALKVLNKSNLDADNYKALSSEYKLVYDSSLNRVLYVESSSNTVVYPEEYKAEEMTESNFVYGAWMSLAGQMIGDDSWRANINTSYQIKETIDESGSEIKYDGKTIEQLKQNNGYVESFGSNTKANLAAMEYKNSTSTELVKYGEYTFAKVNSASQLVSYLEYVEKDNNGKNYNLILSDNVDLNGAQWKSVAVYDGSIDGNEKTISNFVMNDRSAESKAYNTGTTGAVNMYYGFIAVFTGTYLGNLTLEDVTIKNPGIEADNAPTGMDITGHCVGAVAGLIHNSDNEDILIENITVKSGTIEGMARIGGLFGRIGSNAVDKKEDGTEGMSAGTITIRNCVNNANVISNAEVSLGHSTAGGIAGSAQRLYGSSKVVFENCVNNGNIEGQAAGGILGKAYVNANTASVEFISCENNGTVTGLAHYGQKYNNNNIATLVVEAGGILGARDKVTVSVKYENCKSNGKVVLSAKQVEAEKDGFKAYAVGAGTVNNCKSTATLDKLQLSSTAKVVAEGFAE